MELGSSVAARKKLKQSISNYTNIINMILKLYVEWKNEERDDSIVTYNLPRAIYLFAKHNTRTTSA